MKPDTRPTCATCGYVTDGCRCADCPPDRVYCRYHIIDVERIDAKGEMKHVCLCRECDKLHEYCKICRTLTTHHTPNGTCPRCMRVVYMEAEALAREFSREVWREAIDDPDLDVRAVQDAVDMLRDWLMRQRAMAMPADALTAENQVEVAEPDTQAAGFDGKEFYKQQWIRCQTLLANIETALNETTGQETDILTNIAYLAKLKAEIHAAVDAAPDAMAD